MPRERVCAGRDRFELTPAQAARLFRGRVPLEIGSGSRACTYGVNGTAVKFTWHEPDAAAALAVKRHPVEGVLPVKAVSRVGDFYYAIRSRRIPHLPLAKRGVLSVAERCARQGRLDIAWQKRLQAKRRAPAPLPQGVVDCVDAAAPRAGVPAPKVKTFLKELSAAQARLSNETGIHWFDIHADGNFLIDEKGKPVIVDMGQSIVPERYIRALKRPTLQGAARPAPTWHILAEGLALVAGVPVMLAAAARMKRGKARGALIGAALATAAIDSWFIGRQA